jgi:hypothetical protein
MKKILVGFALTIVGFLYRGWALSLLWSWFIVSAFNVSPIGIAQSIGVGLVINMLTHQMAHAPSSQSEADKWALGIAHALIAPTLIIVVGWIVRMFLPV